MMRHPSATLRRRTPGPRLAASACAALAFALAVAGCDYFKDPKPPPLPGDRISVLLNQRTLSPDPELASASILLPAPSPNADWPQAGGYPNHAMQHMQLPDTISRAWSVDIGAGSKKEKRLISSPVVADGRVFVMDSESLVTAYRADNGARLWRINVTPKDEDDSYISGGLAFDRGRIFASTGFGQIVALDAATGGVIWRQSLSGPARAAPTVRGGRVFVTTVDNKLFAINADTGEGLWSHTGAAETTSILGSASPAVGEGVVVVPFTTGELLALKVDTGRLLWQESLTAVKRTDVVSNLAHIRGRPVIDRGRVIAMSHGGLMAAMDLRNGRRLWQRDIGGLESPWVAGNYIFVITNDAEIACINRDDGRVFWVRALPRYANEKKQEDLIIWTGPVLASDRLIVAGSHGYALAISPYTGRIIGQVRMPAGVSVPPVVADNTVYFLANDAELVAYR